MASLRPFNKQKGPSLCLLFAHSAAGWEKPELQTRDRKQVNRRGPFCAPVGSIQSGHRYHGVSAAPQVSQLRLSVLVTSKHAPAVCFFVSDPQRACARALFILQVRWAQQRTRRWGKTTRGSRLFAVKATRSAHSSWKFNHGARGAAGGSGNPPLPVPI